MAPAKKSKKDSVDPLDEFFEGIDFEASEDFGQWGAWPTGMPLIDHLSGIGGFPKGEIIELFGQESSGKSTSALRAIARAQKEGKLSLYFDFEGTFKKKWAEANGINVDDKSTFRILTPETLEQAFKTMRALVEHPEIGPKLGLMVIDSVSDMISQAEIDQGEDGNQPGLRARKLNQNQAILRSAMRRTRSKATLVYINQVYTIIGFGGAPGVVRTTTPGGRATKFGSSLRIEFKIIGQLDGKAFNPATGAMEKIKSGQKVRAIAVKNKASSNAKKTVEYAVVYGVGFDNVYTMTDIALARKLIKSSGAKYTIPGAYTEDGEEKSYTGKDNMRQHFYENDALYSKLEADIMKLLDQRVDTETGDVTSASDGVGTLDLLLDGLDEA